MAKIEIYTTPYCPYCLSAKALLTRKGVSFTEIESMTGRLWQPGCGPSVVEVFLSGTEPRETCGGFFEGSYSMGQFEEPPMISEEDAAAMVQGMELHQPQMIHDPDSADMSSGDEESAEEDTVVDPPPPPPPKNDTLPLRAPS